MLFAWSNLVFIFHNVVVKSTGASPILHFAIPHPFSVRQIRGWGYGKMQNWTGPCGKKSCIAGKTMFVIALNE